MKWKGRVRRSAPVTERRGTTHCYPWSGLQSFFGNRFQWVPSWTPTLRFARYRRLFSTRCLLGFMRPNARYIVHVRFHFGPRGCVSWKRVGRFMDSSRGDDGEACSNLLPRRNVWKGKMIYCNLFFSLLGFDIIK